MFIPFVGDNPQKCSCKGLANNERVIQLGVLITLIKMFQVKLTLPLASHRYYMERSLLDTDLSIT